MLDSILHWNGVALDVARRDYSSPDPDIPPEPDQPGPTYASRAFAIVHLAMYDAYAAVDTAASLVTYLSYGSDSPGTTSTEAAKAAVGSAACLTLTAMFPKQAAFVREQHEQFDAMLSAGPDVVKGRSWGGLVAGKMLAERQGDGSDASNDLYAPEAGPFKHRPDPLTPEQGFLGPLWGNVKPFGFENLKTSIPALADPTTLSDYTADFTEVMDKGRATGGSRTPEETTIGLFWAYDGARNIGLPPRLYNQVVRAIVEPLGRTEAENARLFAMVNVAMADAGIQAWSEKYRHNLWRPVVGIREAGKGWGPTGAGDGINHLGDPYWVPLGAPRTNSSGAPSFTPGFPAYPSGHATFGTAALQVVLKELKTADKLEFVVVSDELNGLSVGATGVRPRHERKLTIATAIEENISSRVYLGVHWRLDGNAGAKIGEEIATGIVTSFPAKA
jgi:hypothetical protein